MPISIIHADITKMRCDAIVNAANHKLTGGSGGLDKAIHDAAGSALTNACRALGGCRTGEAKLTPGFKLPCRFVIHTVGPAWQGGEHDEDAHLVACYWNSLKLATANACESIAFPLISTGAFQFPAERAILIAVDTILRFLLEFDSSAYVFLVLHSARSCRIAQHLFADFHNLNPDETIPRQRPIRERRGTRFAYNNGVAYETNNGPFFDNILKQGSYPPILTAPLGSGFSKDLPALERYDGGLEESFSSMIRRKLEEKEMQPKTCYEKAGIGKKLFSKIMTQISEEPSNAGSKPYHTSKAVAVSIAISLELSLEETKKLLEKAGYALTHTSRSDQIVEVCIAKGIYDFKRINQILFTYGQPQIGKQSDQVSMNEPREKTLF